MSKKEEYIKEMLDVIKKKKIMRFSHCFAFVSFSSATAYNNGLEKVESIKEALVKNRTEGVNYLLQKWIMSDRDTLQIAAMRMICDSDDHRRLNQSYVENKNSNDKPILLDFTGLIKNENNDNKKNDDE